jgi:predicted Zn finger-like uncharacterized protein
MRTRCPACSTTFRVTSEQLRLKAGKVRCGHCQGIFNAFESLIEDVVPPEAIQVATIVPQVALEILAAKPESSREIEPEAPDETVAESTQAARDAGLVAARELAETPAFNRWAAGTLAGNVSDNFEHESPNPVAWPFMLTMLVLGILLAGQLLYFFRTNVVQRLPDAAALYALAAVDVPLPRQADLVGIDVSDLQSDNARGLLVLQATLRNRAAFTQAWPALELTLTDMHDTVISRRVLPANEYLPPGTNPTGFAARSDIAIRLWLETKGVGAAGYRLYLFYP